MHRTRELLEKYSALNENEINYLIKLESSLEYMSLLSDSDIFIDVRYLNEKNSAIVVCEYLKAKSGYEESVVGKLAYRNNEPAALKALDTGVTCNNLKAISQENKDIIQNVVPIIFNQKTIGVLIEERHVLSEDFSNHKIKVLNKEVDILTNVLCNIIGIKEYGGKGLISEGVLIYNAEQEVVYYNEKARQIYKDLGFNDDLNTYKYNQLTLSNVEFDVDSNESSVEAGDYFLIEKKHQLLADEANCIVIISDVTAMKNKDDELYSAKYAIREMHHRIKNNLQIVSSMLRIQSRMSNNNEVKSALDNSIQRILATSSVHEILSKRLEDEADLATIINNLIGEIKQYLKIENKDIKFEFNAQPLILDSSLLTIISIIVNELIMNSVEHAFENRNSGTIRIDIKNDDDHIKIIVEDDGEGYDSSKIKRGLGLGIIDSYVNGTLNGTFKTKSIKDQGSTSIIRFKK